MTIPIEVTPVLKVEESVFEVKDKIKKFKEKYGTKNG
jgi:hypothetical protein